MSKAFDQILAIKEKYYLPLPSNWETDIKPLMVTSVTDVFKFLDSEKIGFYDTCAIMNHSKLSCHIEIAHELKELFDCIIITATTFSELSSVDEDPKNNPISNIDGREIDLLKAVHAEGPPIICLKEEDIALFIHSKGIAYSSINKMLQDCIRRIFDINDSVGCFLSNNGDKFIKGPPPATDTFVTDFFCTLRKNKVQGDSLGELLTIALCNLWIPYEPPFLRIITDDRSCDVALSKLVMQMDRMDKLRCNRLESIVILSNIIRKSDTKNREQLERDLSFFCYKNIIKVTYLDARIGFPNSVNMTPTDFYQFAVENPQITILATHNKKTEMNTLNPYLGMS